MTTATSRRFIGFAAAVGLAAAGMIGVGTAQADGHEHTVVYSGQGLDDGGNIEEVICDDFNSPYVLFVLTATQASSASISGDDFGGDMYRQGRQDRGAFKFYAEIGGDLTELIGEVEATYVGAAQNAQLVISHGCPGDDQPPS